MTLLPLCTVCDDGFTNDDLPWLCAPCEMWAHDRCGQNVLIQNREYFFCKGCNDLDD